jgi:uncharacterized protein YjbI with pentapeptide repeats
MDRDEALKLLKGGQEGHIKWNRYRRGNGPVPDLSKADLSFADLGGSECDFLDDGAPNLSRCNLSEANLSGADLGADLSEAILESAHLTRADLEFTNLRGANLHKATLHDTRLFEVDLRDSNLSGADLTSANFTQAILRGADLTGAVCESTLFANTDLSGVRGLESVEHLGPSTIGTDTLLLSGGKIPKTFLRGCRLPDALIDFLPSLIGTVDSIQFYSCFLSHSSTNKDFARRLCSKMRTKGIRVWLDEEDIEGGKKLHEQIDEAIRVYDKLLLVLSPESMNSEWVRTEIRKARKAEIKEGKRKLFPIRLVDFNKIREWECFDADSGKDLGVEIREFFIPDFSNWKDHDSFESAFARLLKDLKAEESIGSKHD